MTVGWDDPTFRIRSDPARRAAYRRLQSWYRSEVLSVEPGLDRSGRAVSSLLPQGAVDADPTLNFLGDPRLLDIGRARVAEGRGTYSEDRLMRNMLSSQPLCVNLFGAISVEPNAGARVLLRATGLPVHCLESVSIEHTPVAANRMLADRTAFDAYVEYLDLAGQRRFFGVETKYTEPFSNDSKLGEAKRQKYRELAAELGSFKTPLDERLLRPKASQLFRNVLLALAHRRTTKRPGHVLVVALEGDADAIAATNIVRDALDDPDDVLRLVSIESIATEAASTAALTSWAASFRRRYLDLEPVTR